MFLICRYNAVNIQAPSRGVRGPLTGRELGSPAESPIDQHRGRSLEFAAEEIDPKSRPARDCPLQHSLTLGSGTECAPLPGSELRWYRGKYLLIFQEAPFSSSSGEKVFFVKG